MKPAFTGRVGLALSIVSTPTAVITPPRIHAVCRRDWRDTGLARGTTQAKTDTPLPWGSVSGARFLAARFFESRASLWAAKLH
jgi:hypothetical protein